jgi:hypothetical protein
MPSTQFAAAINASYWYRELTFNSDDFKYNNQNNPGFVFDQQIQDVSLLQIHRAIVPTTYYVFSAPYYVSCTINGQAISWPEGNYSASTWIATVSPLLSNTTITYSDVTGKITISTTNATPASISFTGTPIAPATTPIPQLAWELLGFNRGTSTNGTPTLVAPKVAQFSGPNFVYLRSSILASVVNNETMSYSASTTNNVNSTPLYSESDNILAMIPITENTGSVVNYINDSARFLWFSPTTLRRVDFYFTLGNRSFPLNFNGVPFQLRLACYSKDTSNYLNNTVDIPPQ